jgi:hypothetical protein
VTKRDRAHRRAPLRRPDSDAELGFQEIVDGLQVGLAAGGLHHLTDEPAERLRLRLGLGDLVRIGGDRVY